MANYSICGLDCDICDIGKENKCKDCRGCKGNIFWGECYLYKCCSSKDLEHCGLCTDFPCEMLREFAKSEGTERIDNLKSLIANY